MRNESWWGLKPAWERVTFRVITNPAARVAALLSKDADVIDFPPVNDLPRLKSNESISIFSIQSLRMIYIALDFSRAGEEPFITDNAGNRLARNPLLDVRVRQALSFGIDRGALANHVMQGAAVPTGQWLPRGSYSYAPDVPVPAYDPERARHLLSEAGFPQGFRMTLHSPNDRYPNDASVAQAVAQAWTHIGVQTSVDAMPASTYFTRNARQEFSAALRGWGNIDAEATSVLVQVIGSFDPAGGRGSANVGRYSNKALDDLTDKASNTLNDGEREKLLIQATEMTMHDLPFIPLYNQVNTWAMHRGITYEPRMDEITLAMNAHLTR